MRLKLELLTISMVRGVEAYLKLHMKPCRSQVLVGGNMIQRPCY